jgi:HEAT repeat protein
VPALLAALAHKDWLTRKEALKVIGRFKDRRTLEPVIISFRDTSTRREAGQALRDLGPMAEPDVLALLNGDDLFLKRDAIGLLADIGTEKSVPALQKVAASTNIHDATHLRGPAEKALAAIDERKKK